MEGFIQLHRQMIDWEWYDDINTKVLFIHILLKANWKDKQWRGIDIPRGSFITSLENLSHETKLSVRSIRTCLKKLESTNEVTKEGHTSFTLIKVNKYETYQSNDKQNDKQETSERQTNDKQTTTTNKDNKGNKEIIVSKDTTTEVDEPEYGNKEINEMLGFLCKAIGVDQFKESQKYQRFYVKHFINFANKNGKQDFIERLKSITGDPFKLKNCNSLKYLYGEIKSYIHTPLQDNGIKKC